MTTKRKYPIGIQNFEDLRSSGFIYVDKTELIYDLADTGRAYFLSRPRRFGKSLLVSTFRAYFEGKKHLFEGLAIEQLETEWTERTVLHLDFSKSKYNNVEQFNTFLNKMLCDYELIYGSRDVERSFSTRFDGIIQRAAEQSGKQIAVLIDEYDAPLLDLLHDDEQRTAIRAVLRDLFSPLKAQGENIRFLFLTGITKYSQLSIFSELNHLANISMLPQYSEICGITEQELFTNFKEDIAALAQYNGETYDEACAHLKQMYDGYHFSEDCPDIYNPFSILHVLNYKKYKHFWFESATPTFLLDLLQNRNVNVDSLEGIELEDERFNAPIIDSIDVIPTLYHSGYLTIKAYNNRFKTYTIGFPNEEVRQSMVKSLVPRLLPHVNDNQNLSIFHFVSDLESGDIEMFLTRLRSFFADVPNVLNNKTEKHYQTMFYIFTRLIGQYTEVEIPKAIGRIDMLIRTGGYLYLFEFKFNATAAEALAQINSKDYAIAYTVGSDKLIKVGVNFDDTTRTITDWEVEQ